jgi:hypothetical protein
VWYLFTGPSVFCIGIYEWRETQEPADQGGSLLPEEGAVLCCGNHDGITVSASVWNFE